MTHRSPLLGRLVPAHPPPPSLHSLASARAHLPLCLTSQCDTLSQGQSTGAPQPNEPALASTSGASGSTEDSHGPSRSQFSLPLRGGMPATDEVPESQPRTPC